MENGEISDRQITASSQLDASHAATQGRLNLKATGNKAGSWSALSNDPSQWLQVDLGCSNTKVTRVATQGRNDPPQWVTKYKLQFSNDGVKFHYYTKLRQTGNKDFAGNADQSTVVYHELNPPIRARYVRFLPQAWHGHISMRVELYGCRRG
ncbi:EGF-like repeat and discoidin I-like domain-containing protein 3 [Orbicella faveolata]|uniref:EGF-like repeat and discoidin I-like domain-containing protein 3 n=1 Tax=Orbicella faveolata TaxID=48498 RepID=UPI0009E1F8A0|nr:EGF-like repeat and discoidin I-like domain-containing protein 3 [Orbicella faveolata]